MNAAQNGSARAVAEVTAPPKGGTPAVLCVGDPDARLLLKGLLRLHHHPVRAETGSADELLGLEPLAEPTILLYEIDPATDRWEDELRAIGARHAEARPIVLASTRLPDLEGRARCAGARAVLVRPFALRDLNAALAAAVADLPDGRRHP
jgi:CheY-like chemotaxis protein